MPTANRSPRPRRYLDALDSARIREIDAPLDRLAHPYMEMLLSILFGRTISLSENQSFDSYAFLDFAPLFIAARHTTPTHAKPKMYYPFALGLRYTSFRAALCDLFKKPTFNLSGWPELRGRPDDPVLTEKRAKVAELFASSQFEKAASLLGDSATPRLVALRQIDEYFATAPDPTSYPVAPPKCQLCECLATLLAMEDADVDQLTLPQQVPLLAMEARPFIQPSQADLARRTVRNLRVLVKRGISTQNRSGIHDATPEETDISPDELRALRQVYNVCYNAVVASSLKLDSEVLSSSEQSPEDPYVEVGNDLGYYAVVSNMHRSDTEGAGLRQGLTLHPSWGASRIEQSLRQLIPTGLTEKAFEITARREWVDSVARLDAALTPPEGAEIDRSKIEDLFLEHANLVANSLAHEALNFSWTPDSRFVAVLRFISAGIGEQLSVRYRVAPPGIAALAGYLIPDTAAYLLREKTRLAIAGAIRTAIIRSSRLE